VNSINISKIKGNEGEKEFNRGKEREVDGGGREEKREREEQA